MSMCDDARAQGLAKVIAAYGPTIAELLKVIKNMQGKELDPHKFYDAAHDNVIDLPALVADLGSQQEQDQAKINKKVDEECEQSLKFIQDITDAAVDYFSLGISTVLPKHMTHIDVGEILAGKPLGGENSVFNQVRESVFNAFGMGENNDLRKIISDPINTTKNGINDFFERNNIGIRL